MRNKTINIKLWHISVFVATIFSAYVFSTGWQCGFQGRCPGYSNDIWQGVARLILLASFITLSIMFIVHGIIEEWSFNIRNPFYNEVDQEAWEEYQRWLKERK